MFIRVEIFQ